MKATNYTKHAPPKCAGRQPSDRALAAMLLAVLGSSAVPAQSPVWRPVPELTDRGGHMMAYDPFRERIVMFGGATYSIYVWQCLDDTWEWNGSTWELREPKTRPPARASAGFAFDWVRRTVLMFGGIDGNAQLLSDTWEWDGQDWRQIATQVSPGARYGFQMVGDPVRGRIVLFAGSIVPWANAFTNDTWEWDGRTWQQMSPATVPGQRGGHSMAYSIRTRRVVMTAGRSLGLLCYDARTVWEWDGVDWTRIDASGPSPGERCSNGMATDPVTGTVVLHGNPFLLGPDTWRWDGARWTQIASAVTPPKRETPAMATDLARREIILTGVGTLSAATAERHPGRDTWAFDGGSDQWRLASAWPKPRGARTYQVTYDGARQHFLVVGWEGAPDMQVATWTYAPESGFARLYPVTSPPPQDGVVNWSIEYHAASGQVLLYNASNSGAYPRETWVWDGTDWQAPTYGVSPSVDLSNRTVYDPKRKVVLMWLPNVKELWAWAPNGWRLVAPAEPRIPGAFAVAFDVQRDRLIVHGRIGSNLSQPPETWEWDGRAWQRMQPANPGVVGTNMEYVPELGGSVLVALNLTTTLEETWLWDGVDWRQVPVPPMPSHRFLDTVQALAYDPAHQRLLALHHLDDLDTVPNSVWELRIPSLSVDCALPRPGQSVTFTADLPAHAGKPWVCGLALGNTRGVPVRPSPVYGFQWLPLDPDPLLVASLGANLGGVLDGIGRGSATVPIPANPALLWLRFHGAAFAWSRSGSSIDALTHSVDLQIVR